MSLKLEAVFNDLVQPGNGSFGVCLCQKWLWSVSRLGETQWVYGSCFGFCVRQRKLVHDSGSWTVLALANVNGPLSLNGELRSWRMMLTEPPLRFLENQTKNWRNCCSLKCTRGGGSSCWCCVCWTAPTRRWVTNHEVRIQDGTFNLWLITESWTREVLKKRPL